jgi:hypothetical protein
MKIILLLIVTIILSACTSSIHMSQMDVDSNGKNTINSGKVIEIEKSQKNILGFVYDTNYVDKSYEELLHQCPNGTSMVNIEYLTNHSFLSWTDKIRIKAICK